MDIPLLVWGFHTTVARHKKAAVGDTDSCMASAFFKKKKRFGLWNTQQKLPLLQGHSMSEQSHPMVAVGNKLQS